MGQRKDTEIQQLNTFLGISLHGPHLKRKRGSRDNNQMEEGEITEISKNDQTMKEVGDEEHDHLFVN